MVCRFTTVCITVHYHVWDLGRLSGLPNFLMQNFCGPLLPVTTPTQMTKYKHLTAYLAALQIHSLALVRCLWQTAADEPAVHCRMTLQPTWSACVTPSDWQPCVNIYLPKPLDDVICFFIPFLVDSVLSPVINVDLTQSTHKILMHNKTRMILSTK